MKIGDRIYVRGYIDEIRKDTVIVRNDGGYFGTIPSEVITGELPSAQPERRTGHWIIDGHHRRCDVCGICICITDREGDLIPANYCPHCGTHMIEEVDG